MVLVTRLGKHEDWKLKLEQADKYYRDLCKGGQAWNLPRYMLQPDVIPEQICDDPLYRKPCICGTPGSASKEDPSKQSASASAGPQQSSAQAGSSDLCAGGFIGGSIRNWGESGAMKRQWDSDGPVTVLPWKDLGPVDEDLSFLVQMSDDPSCPPCPLDVQSALNGQIECQPTVEANVQYGKGGKAMSYHLPSPLIKFLDIGAPMGENRPEGLLAKPPHKHPLHPRAPKSMPVPNAFWEILDSRLVDVVPGEDLWCEVSAWRRVDDPTPWEVLEPGNPTWGLPLIVRTHPAEMFA